MTDISSGLVSLCGIVLFGAYLLPGLHRWAQMALMLIAWLAMGPIFVRKYLFAQPVEAQIGPWVEALVNFGCPVALILLLMVVARRKGI